VSDDIVLGEDEQTALKWAMGVPWFERLADPATRDAAFGDLCVRLEAGGVDEEIDDLRERLQGLRGYADGLEAERDRLREIIRQTIAPDPQDSDGFTFLWPDYSPEQSALVRRIIEEGT
jgi:hypothetical protein